MQQGGVAVATIAASSPPVGSADVAATSGWLTLVMDAFLAAYAAFMAVLLWIYCKVVTDPLHAFYFQGPIWHNIAPESMCFELTKVDSAWWNVEASRMAKCQELLNARFRSFETTVMCVLYFASLAFTVLYLVFCCCFARPLLREMRSVVRAGSQQR